MNKIKQIIKLPHHKQQEYCTTRARYRQGKKLTAVKVYTVVEESTHLLINGVPSLKLNDELNKLCSRYGVVDTLHVVTDYECEPFTECFHVHYKKIQAARHAKRHLDTRGFFGGVLHVFYAPELETIDQTREKLNDRRREVIQRIEKNKKNEIEEETQPALSIQTESTKRLRSPSSYHRIPQVNPSHGEKNEEPQSKKIKK